MRDLQTTWHTPLLKGRADRINPRQIQSDCAAMGLVFVAGDDGADR